MSRYEECTISIEELDPPYVRLTWAYYSWQNQTRIRKRAERLVNNYARGWNCLRCGQTIDPWKRVDARYCCESCRKMAARDRRRRSSRSKLEKDRQNRFTEACSVR